MSLGNKSGCTQPNNEKIAKLENEDMTLHKEHLIVKKRNEHMIRKADESINPYVTVKGNILVSDCCGAEMLYKVSDKYGFDVWDFCPQCLDCCNTFEVKEDYNREIYLDKYGEFHCEGYDEMNYEIIPKCDSKVYLSKKELIQSGDFTAEELKEVE